MITRRLRFVAALASLLQVGLPALVAFADARLDARPTAPIHLESSSTAACAPIHPDKCALCQFLSAFHSTGASHVVPLREPRVRAAVTPDGLSTREGTRLLGRLARAPPLLV